MQTLTCNAAVCSLQLIESRSKQLSLGDWKLRNKEYQEMLTQDGFLTGEIGDQIDSCFTYGYVDFVRAAGALGLWAQGLR